MNYEKLAHRIYKKACNELFVDLKKFPFDKEMINMYLSDFSDTIKIANYIKNNKLRKAVNLARNMDTAARDKIHQDIWKLRDQVFKVSYDR